MISGDGCHLKSQYIACTLFRFTLSAPLLYLMTTNYLMLLLSARYSYGVAISLRSLRENPECSVDCVLSVIQAISIDIGEKQLAADVGKIPKDDSLKHDNKNKD